jgi:hypothetical protein
MRAMRACELSHPCANRESSTQLDSHCNDDHMVHMAYTILSYDCFWGQLFVFSKVTFLHNTRSRRVFSVLVPGHETYDGQALFLSSI